MNLITRFYVALSITVTISSLASPVFAENKKVTLSQAFQSILYLPVYIAIDNSFFSKQGLDVVKQTAGSPNAALSAVISGSANFSLHGPEWTAIAAAKGAPVNIIANVVNGAAVWIVTTPDVSFSSVKDLRGKSVVTGLMPTTSTSLFMKLLRENGMDPNRDVKMVQVALGSEVGPLVAGQAKVAVMYEPGVEQAVAKGTKVVLGFPSLYGPYAFSAITAKTSVDPDEAQRLVSGLNQGIQFIQTNPQDAIEIAKKEFPTLEPTVIESAVKRMIGDNVYPKTVEIAPDALKVAMSTQIAIGNLAEQPVYEKFVELRYITKALQTMH
jgi:NitT/TauT family transport system substrate-binding protein